MLSIVLWVLFNGMAHQLEETLSPEHPIYSWKRQRCRCAWLMGPHTRLELGDRSSSLGSLLMLFPSRTLSPVYSKLDSCFLLFYGSKILQYGQILLHNGWGACDIESRTSLHTLLHVLHDTSYNLTILSMGVYRYLLSTVGIVKKEMGKLIFINE